MSDENFYLDYKPKYKIFHELMAKRIKNILLVSSIYDSFMLEEDGRLSDQVYEEFQNLNLRTLPRITHVSSAQEALVLLKENQFDLVITMLRLGDIDAFTFGQNVKKIQDIPVVLLLSSVVETNYLPEMNNRKGIDRIFAWNGDSKIFVAIIKNLEDQYNVDYDTTKGSVRLFILVEDSIRFYSLMLPELYSEIMKQTHQLLVEGTTDFQDLMQLRARPKILLAQTYEEAISYFKKYKEHILGIISDIEYPRKGTLDKNAGFTFAKEIIKNTINMPIALTSTKLEYKQQAFDHKCSFIHKGSQFLVWHIRQWILENVGFGNFVFKLPNGEVVGRARNIIDFYHQIKTIPIESLIYHGKNDQFSNWLNARGEFEIARQLKPRKVSEFTTNEDLRTFLINIIEKIVFERTRGIINDFNRENYHPEMLFIRLRPGSLGGKGRGLAFLMYLISKYYHEEEFPDVTLQIPKTIVIGTSEFDKFIEDNNLFEFALSDASDEEIREKFIASKLSSELRNDIEFLVRDITQPLAIRSSSLLEDSAYQPFAGIFNTYMIPNNDDSLKKRIEQIFTAIKLVYASPFLRKAKSYAKSVGQTIEEAKMAVVIQIVVGNEHNNRYYPDFSGTASSYNYYPIGEYMKPEDRIAHLALGLGKIVVEGGETLRFCPNCPKINFFSTPDHMLKNSQKYYYGVNLGQSDFNIHLDDPFLTKFDLGDAIEDKTLESIADNYDFNSQSLKIGYHSEGSPVITFSKHLKLGIFPIAELVARIMELGEKAIGNSIEIEFAGNFRKTSKEKHSFNLLQIRPFLRREALIEKIEKVEKNRSFVYSTQISGNLIRKDIEHIVYIKPDAFDNLQTLKIVQEINAMNELLTKEKIPYILIGFGRWGTADRFLGIPVKWNDISGVKVMVEASLKNFQIDFSQGSHFFQNIITSNIGYFYIDFKSDEHILDWEWLSKQKTITDKKYVRHVKTKKPLIIKVDGKTREGIIIKPK